MHIIIYGLGASKLTSNNNYNESFCQSENLTETSKKCQNNFLGQRKKKRNIFRWLGHICLCEDFIVKFLNEGPNIPKRLGLRINVSLSSVVYEAYDHTRHLNMPVCSR